MTNPSPLPTSHQAAGAPMPMLVVCWAEHTRQLDPKARGRLAAAWRTGAAMATSDRQSESCLLIGLVIGHA